MTSNPERDLHTYLAADVAHSDRDGSERGYGGAAYLAARREQRRIDSEPCPKCGGDKLRPDTTLGWSCHARSSTPAGLPLHEPTDRDASDVPSDRVRAYADAFRARTGPRCAECVELDDWSDCAECDAVVAVEVADREQAELRAEVERWRGRADRRLAEAKKAEAENERLRAGLYPLSQWTPEQAAAFAEDVGASTDSLFADWIRRGQTIARVEALHHIEHPTASDEMWDTSPECSCGGPWPCQTFRALRGPEPTDAP